MSKQQSVLEYLVESQGKTLPDLAEFLGVEQSTPYRWARGTRKPLNMFWDGIIEFLKDECDYDDDFVDILDAEGLHNQLSDTYEGSEVQALFKMVEGQVEPERHPIHEYLENIVGVPIRPKTNQEFDSIDPVIRANITEMIEDHFKAFLSSPLRIEEFLQLTEAYTKFYAGVD